MLDKKMAKINSLSVEVGFDGLDPKDGLDGLLAELLDPVVRHAARLLHLTQDHAHLLVPT